MSDWKLVYDEAVFQFIVNRSGSERRRILLALETLRAAPTQDPDYRLKDSTGRDLSVRACRPVLVTYWLDSFINEIRILDIQFVRDR